MMNSNFYPTQAAITHWICPDLTLYWKLTPSASSNQVILTSLDETEEIPFDADEAYALSYFTGKFTIGQIQDLCQQKFKDSISENFVWELVQKLMDLRLLEAEAALQNSLPKNNLPSDSEQNFSTPKMENPLLNLENSPDLICPNITDYWQLGKLPDGQIILKAKTSSLSYQFSTLEGFALRHFTGQFSTRKIQHLCQQEFREQVSSDFVTQLLQKLLHLQILAASHCETSASANPSSRFPQLKSSVHWIEHPEGYWILRNAADVTFLQVSPRDKDIIDQLSQRPPQAIIAEFCISQHELKKLLQLLTATGMLEGTQPVKPTRRKFTPFSLLSFRIPLFNPDPFLNRYIDSLRWIWTRPFLFLLCLFLAACAAIGFDQRQEIFYMGQQMLSHSHGTLIIPFALMTALVVTLHELGHAFTLKHYGGIVPEIGLWLIMLMPAAYTNTSDSYCLVKRWQRSLVVGAGILVQLILAAIALCVWNSSLTGTWLHTTSYLLMAAALFTIAINLNPLAKFDGYYLAVAVTGINNLRSRAFGFYSNLLTGKPIEETGWNRLILAVYAPFSLAYIYFIFGFLLFRVLDWSLTNIPTTALIMLLVWAIYFYFPSQRKN